MKRPTKHPICISVFIPLSLLYILLIAPVQTKADEHGQCVWYDECTKKSSNIPPGPFNCYNPGPAKPLNDAKGISLLKMYCPDLAIGDNPSTCCSTKQLETMATNMAVPSQIFSRCPSCYHNFLNLYCYMSCSPNQSKWLRAASLDKAHNRTYIKSVDYFITPTFVDGMFNACKDVQVPSANMKALGMVCGTTAAKCTPKIWVDYMGNIQNGQTPFTLNFTITNQNVTDYNETFYPMNHTIIPCSKAISNGTSACSCQDCESSCSPIPPPPPPTKPWLILDLDGAVVIASCIFIIFTIAFGIYVIIYNIFYRNALDIGDSVNETNDDCCNIHSVNGEKQLSEEDSQHKIYSYDDISFMEKIGSKFENFFVGIFTRWGIFCAKHAVMVLAVGLVIVLCLAGGIFLFKVTTDPVLLWSAADSQARQEKDYFDNHFGPFFRTEQLIITRPMNQTPVPHQLPPPSPDFTYFTSLFDKEFLYMVLDLQDEIQNLKAPHEDGPVGLEDICFKPLEGDNDNCTIQSVLQYYQNSKANLDKIKMDSTGWYIQADYLDHLTNCVNAPASPLDTTGLEMPCLAESGQPIFPWIIFGGYDGKNYSNATALVMTFVVNNHVDDKLNGKAKAWEGVFLNFIRNFSSPNMTIAYMAERSIQDELDRESQSDVVTILISYMIMFAYISIALGKFPLCWECSLSRVMHHV
ncbi:hypothetical protein ScPMuIL_008864 [Solemya velum]